VPACNKQPRPDFSLFFPPAAADARRCGMTLFMAATVTPQVYTIGWRKRRRAGSALMTSRDPINRSGSDHERMERM
jgi:hypothetical protein